MGVPYAEVIGDPIAHSKSPLIHRFWLQKRGLEGDYRATRVTADELPAYLAARRADPDWRGCNVTMPLKARIEPLLDHIDASAEWAGSVNCVFWDGSELSGCNTDASGIGMALQGAPVQHSAVAVIGSGAAARTALWSLSQEPAGDLHVVARNRSRAQAILEALRTSGRCFGLDEAEDAFSGVAAIVNATPLGMTGFDEMPTAILEAVRYSRIDAAILDMVYYPVETELLSAARRFGRRAVDGLAMLVGQAQDSFMHFFPASPPWRDPELRELLTR